ncbi:serine/threonine-protein kinase [Actinosynnema pretiosum]|uniref:non-specific serine/threonine protein kinase n=1 Tax=Actinosynnema pretiosum TaxID=42197 RepID=A0A290ZCJ9_9PSEU|nr:serine/threonine-protein kinase [Actinosynnema pretiosum]ATE56738.1 serine/threonine protein kinase [Actinosynnema pretiosum]
MTGQQSAPPVRQPRVIAGRYTLLAELGRGGMGVVWRAQDNVIGRQVAIKELHLPDGIAHEERRVLEERVLREARTAGRLNDPAIVTVFDVVAENGMTYIVMELVEATTLSALVAQHGPMPQDRVASLALQALSALETAHQAGIVHRDVKPGNLMITPNGRVKLADFGIAQAVDDPRLTTSGSLIGSPAYMAPERIHGHEAAPAADLWSLGATLCFAVEGVNPYERSTTASTLHAIMSEPPRLTRAHGALGAVVTGLLMTDPAARLTGPQARAMLERAAAQPTPPGGVPRHPGGTVSYTQHAPAPTQQVKAPVRPWLRNLAIGGAAAAALLVFTGGVFAGRAAFTESPPEGLQPVVTFGSGGALPDFSLSSGYCGDNFLGPTVKVNSASCEDDHSIQVFASSNPFGSADDLAYPGDAQLHAFANEFCSLSFASSLVTATDKTALVYAPVVPTAANWRRQYADTKTSREVFCVLWNKDGSQLAEKLVDR